MAADQKEIPRVEVNREHFRITIMHGGLSIVLSMQVITDLVGREAANMLSGQMEDGEEPAKAEARVQFVDLVSVDGVEVDSDHAPEIEVVKEGQ